MNIKEDLSGMRLAFVSSTVCLILFTLICLVGNKYTVIGWFVSLLIVGSLYLMAIVKVEIAMLNDGDNKQ